MSLAFFITAVLVVLVLKQQAARHRVQIHRTCTRLGRAFPPVRRKISKGEAWLTLVAGLPLISLGVWEFSFMIEHPELQTQNAAMDFGVLMLGAGLAIVVVGVRGVRITNSSF